MVFLRQDGAKKPEGPAPSMRTDSLVSLARRANKHTWRRKVARWAGRRFTPSAFGAVRSSRGVALCSSAPLPGSIRRLRGQNDGRLGSLPGLPLGAVCWHTPLCAEPGLGGGRSPFERVWWLVVGTPLAKTKSSCVWGFVLALYWSTEVPA